MTSLTPFQTYFHLPFNSVTEPLSQFGLGLTDAVSEQHAYQREDEQMSGWRKTSPEATSSSLSRSELNTRLRHLIERSIEVVALRG